MPSLWTGQDLQVQELLIPRFASFCFALLRFERVSQCFLVLPNIDYSLPPYLPESLMLLASRPTSFVDSEPTPFQMSFANRYYFTCLMFVVCMQLN